MQASHAISEGDSESESLEEIDSQSEFWAEEEVDISPEDEAAMAAFLTPMAKQRTLADIILEKIEEKKQRQALQIQGYLLGFPSQLDGTQLMPPPRSLAGCQLIAFSSTAKHECCEVVSCYLARFVPLHL